MGPTRAFPPWCISLSRTPWAGQVMSLSFNMGLEVWARPTCGRRLLKNFAVTPGKRFPQRHSIVQTEGDIAKVSLAIMAERMTWPPPSSNYCSVVKPSPPTGTQGSGLGEQNLPQPLQNRAFAATCWLWEDTLFIMQMTLRVHSYQSLQKRYSENWRCPLDS